MRTLVDTQLLLQALTDDAKLSDAAREIFGDPTAEVFMSAASLWEVSVKYSLGKIAVDPTAIATAAHESGFRRLEVEDDHLQTLARMPWKNDDLFGRIIVAQSIAEPMKLLTSDWRLAAYGGPVVLV